MSFVLTAAEAALPIKCYGPELMVIPIYSISDFDSATTQSEKSALVELAVAKANLRVYMLFSTLSRCISVTIKTSFDSLF